MDGGVEKEEKRLNEKNAASTPSQITKEHAEGNLMKSELTY